MASVLSSFFSRDPKSQFPYDLPSTAVTTVNGISIGNSFKKAEPDELATVFWCHDQSGILKEQAGKLKRMRHPNILAFQESLEVDGVFYLVTEKCKPLGLYLDEMSLTGNQKEFVVSWGLFQILNTLKFLHDEAKLSQENIRKSIYVTAGGDWKIGGLHLVKAFSDARADLNQLALVLWEVFNGFNEGLVKPEAPGKIPKRLHDLYKKIAMPAAARLSVAELVREQRMASGFLKNKFVDTLLFLEEFQLKEANEKQSFFMHLRENLDIFPDDIAKYKILPKLIQTYEYGDAGPNILIPLFKLGRLLDEAEYQRRIVPCLVKLFGSPDRTTRVKLLERIDEFAPHLNAQVLNDKIFTNLVNGFLDTSPAVRESTVKAMVSLAEKLNFHNLNVELMKYMARLQGSDEHGGIRTNTTICLGKIGSFLDPSKRQGILLGAFSRGMKDPFPPARMASVLALSATQQFYTIMEIANRVLPALSPLTCDPEKQVRDQAFKAITGFLEKLEKASENPELIPELESQVKAGGRSLLDSDKVPQWASWALKSLSGKFYKGTPPPENKPGQPGETAGPEKKPSTGVSAKRETTPSSVGEVKDGWGEMDDDDLGAESEKDEWADAVEPKAESDDDWSSGWEKPAPTTAPKVELKKPVVKKPSVTGGLKLNTNKTTTSAEDDLIDLFGTSASISTQKKNSTTTAPVASSGWDDFDATPSSGGNDWGDDSWSAPAKSTSPAPATASKVLGAASSKEKDARRAEIAARNEARKQELAAKRAAKTGGALKLASVEKKMDDFADW